MNYFSVLHRDLPIKVFGKGTGVTTNIAQDGNAITKPSSNQLQPAPLNGELRSGGLNLPFGIYKV